MLQNCPSECFLVVFHHLLPAFLVQEMAEVFFADYHATEDYATDVYSYYTAIDVQRCLVRVSAALMPQPLSINGIKVCLQWSNIDA